MSDVELEAARPLNVERLETGQVSLWLNLRAGKLAIRLPASDAEETGRRMLVAARAPTRGPLPVGQVSRIAIAPPKDAMGAAELLVELSDGQQIKLMMGLRTLGDLAATAARALSSVQPEGSA